MRVKLRPLLQSAGTFGSALFRHGRGATTAFVVFLCAFLAIGYLHLRANTAPPRWDEAWYLTNTEITLKAIQGNDVFSKLYYGIGHGNRLFLINLLSRLLASPSAAKAPLIVLLPLPVFLILGSGFQGLVVTLLALTAVFAVGYYALAARLSGPWTALLTVGITSTMPLVWGLSRYFLPEYGLMVLVVLWVYFQIVSENLAQRRTVFPLGILLGLGMLMKVTFPIYILGPVLWGVAPLLRKMGGERRGVRHRMWNGLSVLAIAAIIMGGWYIRNFSALVANAVNAGLGSASTDYSLGPVLDPRTLASYWANVVNLGFSFYHSTVLACCIIAVIIRGIVGKRRVHDRGRRISGDGTLQLATLWFVIPFVFFTLGVNKDIRYLLPALPAVGLMTARLITRLLKSEKALIPAVPLLLAFPCVLLGYTSLPLPFDESIRTGPFVLLAPELGYARRPVTQAWPQREILLWIGADARIRDLSTEPAIGLIPNHEFFNVNNFALAAVQNGLPYRLQLLGAPQMKGLLAMDYLVTKTGDQGPSFAYDPGMNPLLESGGLPFMEVARFPLPDGSQAVIYKRTVTSLGTEMQSEEPEEVRGKGDWMAWSAGISTFEGEALQEGRRRDPRRTRPSTG